MVPHTPVATSRIAKSPTDLSFPLPLSKLEALREQASLPDPVEAAAGYGRWWHDPQSGQLLLSPGAADFLGVTSGMQPSIAKCFSHAVSEDLLVVAAALAQARIPGLAGDCEFRVVQAGLGLRWLRLQSLPQRLSGEGIQTGVLLDVTATRHVAMRERFCFEVTQLLVGTQKLGEAVTTVLQLVCENLGWEWGAYWALNTDVVGGGKLRCLHYWSCSESALEAFTRESRNLGISVGEGLVGHVWNSGEATWVDDIQNDPYFLRSKGARECDLHSGYAFPVMYTGSDGRQHNVGVLEFFSSQLRQQEAQLPNLSAAIGALIAQTVQRVRQQEYVRQLAQTDDLTGLANRSHFHHLLELACLKQGREDARFGLLYIDLDRFKPINDAFGHDAGNQVLREFAIRLKNFAPIDTHIGRLGGDEFVILAPLTAGVDSAIALQGLAEQVLLAARLPFQYEGHELTVSASVGISVFSENGWTSGELLRAADVAMYRSKKGGRNAISFFSGSSDAMLAEQQNSLAQEITLESELHRALLDNAFFLEYQPVLDIQSGRMLAVEALIRWRRASGELVPPDVFIGIAEKSRLIVQIGRWVVRQACRDLGVLHRVGFADLKVHVNMAATEFTNISLPYELTAVIKSSGISPEHLCLELTEGMVMKHPEKVIPVMQMLRQLGFHISLDDFGIGHSSLSRLKKLPISSLKIDRSFVAGLPKDRGDGAIVRSILDLGRHLKLSVIAEGVETDAQLLYLAQFGCALAQGYLLGRPLSVDKLIEAHKPSCLQC